MSTWTGAVSTDWNNVGNWAAGGTGTGIPNAGVDAIFSGTPTNPCIMGANRFCRALIFTGYTSTLTVGTFTLQANNNITFQSDQLLRIIGTTGKLACQTSGTITSNGGIWGLDFTINNVAATITLADDMRVAGSWLGSGGGTVTLAGAFTLFVGTNITTSNSLVAPVTNVVMNGSGTYSGNNAYNLEINTTGNIIITGNVQFTRRFIITNAGSITMTAANVTISNATTVDLGGRAINNLTHSFSVGFSTIIYLSDVVCNNFTIGNGTNTYNGPGQIYASGNYVFSGISSGSLIVNLIGTGTIGAGTMGLSCVIASSGNYTLGATLTINNTFTSAIGAILNAASSTVTINNGVTISTIGLSWNNITIPFNATITINAQLLVAQTLLLNGGTNTFTGTHGWTCGTLNCTAPIAVVIVLQAGVTYITTTSVNMLGTNAQRITMRSNTPTVLPRAIWTLQNPSTQSMVYVNGQGIDSSAGSTIWSFGGTITTPLVPLNWGLGSPQITKAFTFVC